MHHVMNYLGFQTHTVIPNSQGNARFADGRGAINPKGLKYYNVLINKLIEHGKFPLQMLS